MQIYIKISNEKPDETRTVTFLLFELHTKRKRGIYRCLLHSLGPENTRTMNKQEDTHAFLCGHLPPALFLLVLIEFLRYKEYKNKRGKRFLTICQSFQIPIRSEKTLQNKSIFGKSASLLAFLKPITEEILYNSSSIAFNRSISSRYCAAARKSISLTAFSMFFLASKTAFSTCFLVLYSTCSAAEVTTRSSGWE